MARVTRKELSDGWSARLERIGWRFAGRSNTLKDWRTRQRFRFGNEDRSFRQNAKEGDADEGRVRLSRDGQCMVGSRVRNVVVRVVVGIAVVVIVTIENGMSNGREQIVQVCCGREMDRDVIEIEGDESSNEQTTPQSRLFWRAASTVWIARYHIELLPRVVIRHDNVYC
jgi:hypothetical protein